MVSVIDSIKEHEVVFSKLSSLIPQIESFTSKLITCLQSGGKLLVFGNGGSAADAQHIAAELIGRYKKERIALPAIALTTDTSILTSLSNDYDFRYVFARQVQALCQPNDVVIGISTSGNSGNIIEGLKEAIKKGAYTCAFTGSTGGSLKELAHSCICVPSDTTARIQEAHIFIGHVICEKVENFYSLESHLNIESVIEVT